MEMLTSIFIFFPIFLFLLLSGCLCQQFWVLKVAYYFTCLVLVGYKLVACKKCKALIIIIISPLALYNINLLTELNWKWRQIRHATVKKHCVMICGNQIFPPGHLSPMTFPQGNWPPDNFFPRKIVLDISPWTTTPRTTSPYKILPKKITLRTFALWMITPE